MDINFGDIQAETIGGTEPESVYMVIAKKNGLKLAIRPLVEAMPVKVVDSENDYRAGLILGARLRVVSTGDTSHTEAEKTFGILGFNDKGKHSSQVIGITLAPLPCGVDEARRRWKDDDLTNKLVTTLIECMAHVGVAQCVSEFAVAAWLDQEYENRFPETPAVLLDDSVTFNIAG